MKFNKLTSGKKLGLIGALILVLFVIVRLYIIEQNRLRVMKSTISTLCSVNDALISTNLFQEKKLRANYSSFDVQYALNPNKIKPYFDNSKQIQKLSNELVEYINKLKFEVIAKTEGGDMTIEKARQTPLNELSDLYNYSVPTKYFMGGLLSMDEV